MKKAIFCIVIGILVVFFTINTNPTLAKVNVNIWVNPCNTWSNVNCYNSYDNWQYTNCYDCFCNNSCYTPPIYVCSYGTVVSYSWECPRYYYPSNYNYNYGYNNYDYTYNYRDNRFVNENYYFDSANNWRGEIYFSW